MIELVPITLREANEFVANFHRHSRPVARNGGKFAIGCGTEITYTLASETGASLRGAGWRVVAEVKPGSWSRPNIGRLRDWQPIYGQQKIRWEKA